MKRYGMNEMLDVLIVGAGPAALGTLYEARQQGLKAVALDKGPVAGALLHHPTYMRWFSTFDKLELAGFPLICTEKNPTRREYLQYLRTFVKYYNLQVVAYHEVTAIDMINNHFRIVAQDIFSRPYIWESRNVVMATGFYDSPRSLRIPGADLPKVSYRYSESHFYANHDVVIIGSGSSAAEVALELYRADANVTVVMRSDQFATKYWIEPDIENRIKEGSIQCYRNAELLNIGMDEVTINTSENKQITIPNDFVLAMTGYIPNTSLLEKTGALVDTETRKPVLNTHFESTIPGLYIAGTLCAGCESNVVFVENSREHGPKIISHIVDKM